MTEWTSDFTGSFYNYLSPGCKICQQGASLVLFVTGLCGRDCFYCPLSDKRRGKDVVYANERRANATDDIIDEAYAIGALGTGITGGEPLLKRDFVIQSIRALKKEFGEDHHIHLYTGVSPGHSTLNKLRQAGLDEIRFHPDLSNTTHLDWLDKELTVAKSLGMVAGVEIPALQPWPALIAVVRKSNAFLNLNQLEFSETNQCALNKRGFQSLEFCCGAVGSEDVAKEHFMINDIKVHYCSSRFKDAVQLRERLKRRAERTARSFDLPTDDGTLIVGTIEPSKADGFDLDYTLKLLDTLRIPNDMYCIVGDQVEIAGWILSDITEELKDIGCNLNLVERYPIEDGPLLEMIPL